MAKIYLSPAAHEHDNPCSYDRAGCGENVHCNRYMDELEPYLAACGFEVKRNPRGRVGAAGLRAAVQEANRWGADLYYVAHTNAGGGCRNGIMLYSDETRAWAEKLRARRLEVYPYRSNISLSPELYEINQTAMPCLYEELVFHDHLEDITWLHTHFREEAAATAKAFCDIFGAAFVDPYAGGEQPAPAGNPYAAPAALLQKGSRGDGVKWVQWELERRGYDLGSGGVDGIFGDKTDAGVRAVQTAAGIQVDGIVGPDTRGALKADGEAGTPPQTATYTVKAGDNLSRIGSKLGVPWRKIAEANGIAAPWIIRPGQVLVIPEVQR